MAYPASMLGVPFAHHDPVLARSRSRAGRGELEYEALVAPSVTVTWDPATPRRCVACAIERPDRPPDRAHAEIADHIPWLRLAAVTMLDHRLNMPLSRSLLAAELVTAQVAAARTLTAAEPIRDYLIERALVGARRAARGVVHYLQRFVVEGRRPPASLEAALDRLAGSYAALSGEIAETEYDVALDTVTEAWHRLTTIERGAARIRGVPATVPVAPAERPSPGADMIDPRLLPARVLRLGPTSDAAEISVIPVCWRDSPAVRVQVAAFANEPSPDDVVDVGIRLVERRSGRVCGHGLLGRPPARRTSSHDSAGHRNFEGVVVLPGAVAAQDVRVDLYQVTGDEPGPPAEAAELRRVRRATLFLATWRGIVADVRLGGTSAEPTARLRAIVRRLAGSDDAGDAADRPLWAGGPARTHLARLADLGDRALTTALRAAAAGRATPIPGDDGGSAAIVASVSGPGDLLAAELAAAHERAGTRRTTRQP